MRLAAYELSVLAHAEHLQVGAETGATSTGAWIANTTLTRKNTTTAQVRLAVALETRWHRVREALASAAMNPEQTRVVITALEDLPEDLDHDLLTKAEETLVGYATVHDPVELTTLGPHILAVIAPEVGDALNKKRLEEAERRAGQQRRLTLSFDGHGTTHGTTHGTAHGRFQIPTAQGRMPPATSPPPTPARRMARVGWPWVKGRPSAQRLREAFCELVETYPRTSAPRLGRVDGTFIVTTTHTFLTHGLGTATLDDGTEITAAQARRLACEARIIPAVLWAAAVISDSGPS